jgi:hypothetical protein
MLLGDSSCGFNNALLSLENVGGGVGLVLSFFRRAGAPSMSLELLFAISKFVRVFSVKLGM